MSAKRILSAFVACTIATSLVLPTGVGNLQAASATIAVDTPVTSASPGRYEQSVTVTLMSPTVGADIYYTLDGTMPDETSLRYSGPFSITESTNVAVIAVKNGVWSKAATFGYIIKSTEKPILSFAAMSDIHVSPGTDEVNVNTIARYNSNFDVLASVLPNPDAILVAGDLINDNNDGQGATHQYISNVLQGQLKRKNWAHVPIQIAIGNHDAGVDYINQYYPQGWFSGTDKGYYEKTIKKYAFIFLDGNTYNSDTTQRNWLKDKLAKLTADPANRNKPIFITLHHPITGTVMDGQQTANPNLYTDLKDYPQVVVLSGHSHLDINEERAIYQKDFTSVNLGSMSYIETDRGYSAVTSEGLMDNRFNIPDQQSEIFEVYPDRIEIERIEYNGDPGSAYTNGQWDPFHYSAPYNSAGALAGKRWVIKLQGNTKDEMKHNFTYTTDNRDTTAPQFPTDPELKMAVNAGNVPTLSFRQAKDNESMHHYEINVYNQRTAQVVKSYKVLSDFYFSPIPNRMNIPLADLNAATSASYMITVTAVDAYGNKSSSIQTNYRTTGSNVPLTPIDQSTMWKQLVADLNFDDNLNDKATSAAGLAIAKGNVTYVAGKSGQAISIAAGSGNYVELGDRADLKFGSGDFTVSFWHTGNLAGDQTVITNKGWEYTEATGWFIGPAVVNGMSLNMGDGTHEVSNAAAGVGTEWHLFTITVDRTNKVATTYIDGVPKATADISQLANASMDTSNPIRIGTDGDGQYGGATVTLDDLKIWQRALSETEAKALSDAYAQTTLYTFDQLQDKIQQADQLVAKVTGTVGLSLPAQVQTDLMDKLASAKALLATDQADSIDASYMDLMWALQNAQQSIIYSFIPKSNFSIDSFSSYADNQNAVVSNILDGLEDTIWISKWETPMATFPHWIIMDMKDTYSLSGIQRKSRPTSSLEAPRTFDIYASNNLDDLSNLDYLKDAANKVSGEFNKTWTGKVYSDYTPLAKPVQGRYVKLVITGTFLTSSADTYTSMSELDFTGAKVSGDASLADLKVNGRTVEHFASDVLSYAVTVPNEVTQANISYTAANPSATVAVYGGHNLNEGINTANVTVTAQDGTTRAYGLEITRQPADGTSTDLGSNGASDASLADLKVNGTTVHNFAPDVLNYVVTVPNEVSHADISYTVANPSATVAVYGGDALNEASTAASISATAAVYGSNRLAVGANTIDVQITAKDRITTRIYRVVISREATAVTPSGSTENASAGGQTAGSAVSVSTPTVTASKLPKDAVALKDEDLQSKSGPIHVVLAKDQHQLIISQTQVDKLLGRSLQLQVNGVSLNIVGDLLATAGKILPIPGDATTVTIKVDAVNEAQGRSMLTEAGHRDHGVYTLAGSPVAVTMIVTDTAGKQVEFKAWHDAVTMTWPIPAGVNTNLVGIYDMDQQVGLTYLGGQRVNNNAALEVAIDHNSRYAVVSFEKVYRDISNQHWAFNPIQALTAQHILNGVTDSSFMPSKDVTRAEFISMLVRALGLKSDQPSVFSDVTFEPNRGITREEMAVMLVRAAELRTGQKLEQATVKLSDASSISKWAVSYVNGAIQAKLLTGPRAGVFEPKRHSTRAETAQAIYNLIK